MPYSFNPFTGKLDEITKQRGVIISATEPLNKDLVWINTDDNTLYIYWGSWQSTGITLTPPVAPEIATGQPMGLWLPFYRTYQL